MIGLMKFGLSGKFCFESVVLILLSVLFKSVGMVLMNEFFKVLISMVLICRWSVFCVSLKIVFVLGLIKFELVCLMVIFSLVILIMKGCLMLFLLMLIVVRMLMFVEIVLVKLSV